MRQLIQKCRELDPKIQELELEVERKEKLFNSRYYSPSMVGQFQRDQNELNVIKKELQEKKRERFLASTEVQRIMNES